jgi:hypothetical protein
MSASINTSPSNLKQLKKKLSKFWEIKVKKEKYKQEKTKKLMPSGSSIRDKKLKTARIKKSKCFKGQYTKNIMLLC